MANYSKRNASILTLLRTEKNIRLSVGVTDTCGSLSSAKSDNDNELIVTDGWFAVVIIIWIVVLLYFPAIFIFFRPSEIKLEDPDRTQEVQENIRTTDEAAERKRRRLHLPVQSTDRDYYIERDIREGHAPPTEHDAMFLFQSNSSSAGSHEGLEIEDLDATNDSQTKSRCRFSDVRTSNSYVPLRSETPPTVLNESSTTNDQLFSCDEEFDSAVDSQDIKEPISTRNINDSEQASTSQSDKIIEEPSDANIQSEKRVVIDQSSEEEEDALVIIVGETYPVGFGSRIGNKLFSTTHESNIAWNIVKLIFMFSALPLLFFLGLGDLFLVLLPKLHSRLSDHFPFPFLTGSLGYGFLTSHPIQLIPIVFSALAYLIRLFSVCFLSSSTLVGKWQSCSVHRMHPTCFACKLVQCFISELPSSLKPCKDCCKPAPSECSKHLDLPQNISHNLKKQPDIFIKCWKCCSYFRKRKSICSLKGVLFLLAFLGRVVIIIIFFIIGIFCTSPLVCLCHGRLRLFGYRVIESVVMIFSLVWVTIFSLLCTIPLGVATTGLIKLLGSHTTQVLPQVTILSVSLYFFWSCYKSFREPYRFVAESVLASRYQNKFDQHDQNSGVSALIHYKQGEFKVIPKELFDDGCKKFGLSVKNDVARLFVKLGSTLLLLLFVFPILRSDSALNPITTGAVITFLLVADRLINKDDIPKKFQRFEADADKVVNDYIAGKQQDSS